MRPPFPYFGGKQRIAEQIISLMPEHGHYVEPYAGGLSVLYAKEPAKHETVNDLDGNLMTFWRVLREQPEELYNACFLTPWSRDELALPLTPDLSDVERARRVWVKLTQGRGARLVNTGWRFVVDPNSPTSMASYRRGYLDRLLPAAERLANVCLESRDALQIIEKYGKFDDTLLYVDPPYLFETRGKGYAVEMGDEESHRALAEALNATKGKAVLSGYRTELYDQLYADWNVTEIKARANVGDRVEVVWTNY
jgi:DNA adenine methylase